MKDLLRLLIKIRSNPNLPKLTKTTSGFTMIELLVGTIIAVLITIPLLSFVVDILNRDVWEQAKANSEQDIQGSLDYIKQDLTQALYIYNQAGITQLLNNTPPPIPTDDTPILVFWKRDVVEKATPATTATTYADCNTDQSNGCNDTFIMSLVAYYLVQENDPNSIWCQPSGTPCPTRITRFEVKDGVRDPDNFAQYVCDTGGNCDSDNPSGRRQRDDGFNSNYDLSDPTSLIAGAGNLPTPITLVNYLDQSTVNVPAVVNCQTALGSATATLINETTISGAANPTNSFYACVDTNSNLARVYIRGNSLRRIQTDADYSSDKATYFPSGTVQVKGQSGL